MSAPANAETDAELLERLRAGDEDAFMELVDALQPAMLRVARMYVSSQAVAEEVVGDAWLGVLKGLDRFEGRSSLRTWIFRIVTNIAKTRGQ
ncbi:MAG TPA: sigma-70 family RNA polymerase sigma factor, partial [Actinomycetota bacterium]